MSEAQLWRTQASRDLSAARTLLGGGVHGHAAFHAQQVIEKTLKSVIIGETRTLPRTHDLVVLAEKSAVPLAPEEVTLLEELNVLYTSARYPGEWGLLPEGQPSAAQVAGYLRLAETLLTRTAPPC
jgi:HEPN domain-containing protein